MNNLFEISSEERNRILNLHESATKRQYLTLEQSGQQSGGVSTTKLSTPTSFPEQNVGNQFNYGEYQSNVVINSIVDLFISSCHFLWRSESPSKLPAPLPVK